ncbi:TetR/AcrR family transcriptional regulator [Chitinophaga solisilvae]|uniref:TetR/AcrR family transcriptional regulator n=1 Tax=Chitinophaga solisilvae TaxID=1233460 RepID=UPI00136C2081|nr:TetR/AcrR family transcriptional regulator [Chitinophaga solisilvae]
MAGRSRIFDEQRVIQLATAVFWEKGYEATSTDDLQAAMGIGKGSFYNAFPGGKKEVFEKALDHFNTAAFEQLQQQVAVSKKPVFAILEFFRNIASDNRHTHMKGCLMGNTIAELSNVDKGLEQKAARRLQQMETLFREVITAAQLNGDLTTKAPADLLARHLLNLWNGLGITRRMYPTQAGLASLIEMNLAVIS